jgi:hypothetical protein
MMPKAAMLGVFLMATSAFAAEKDPCAAPSSVSDVRFELALKDHAAVFQAGEIVPLQLTFTSSTKNRYTADVRNYDRSGRLGIEYYCVEPEAADPLESYFKHGAFLGGGLGSEKKLDETPFTADSELNEWRTLAPGHYRVYAISCRVWRPPDAHEDVPYNSRVGETVRSNTIEIAVSALDPEWQGEQLHSAVETLAGKPSREDAIHAARILRFLNTRDSTRELAKLFWGLNQQQPVGWELMFGLYGSPYRQVAIDAMRAELAVPGHAITNEFLGTLVNLQLSADAAWDFPSGLTNEESPTFWERRRAHEHELMKAETETVLASVSRKTGSARALTLHGLLMAGEGNSGIAQTIRPALVAAWADLPAETQQELIQYRWPAVAGPEMLPILRKIVAEPLPQARTAPAMTRDAALKHLFELDAAAGREAILADLKNGKAQPSLAVVKLLPKEDLAMAARSAVERIGNNDARELDYELVDGYADATALPVVRPAFENAMGKWACVPQSAMLRYFLRVAPEYGASQVSASLNARKDTACYRTLLSDLGAQLPQAQQSAIDAMDDPDPLLVVDAVGALRKWGSKEAEAALWARLERFHTEWAGREDQLRSAQFSQSPEVIHGATLEQALAWAIAKGTNWSCPPDELARLAGMVHTKAQVAEIEGWSQQWKGGSASINPTWFPEDSPTFWLLQYDGLTEEQLRAKIAQLPRGMQLEWQFWKAGQISPAVSMEKQEAVYERVRAVAEEHGVVLGKANR